MAVNVIEYVPVWLATWLWMKKDVVAVVPVPEAANVGLLLE